MHSLLVPRARALYGASSARGLFALYKLECARRFASSSFTVAAAEKESAPGRTTEMLLVECAHRKASE
eukprot:5064616-Prymnesium_polylepis.1